MIYTLFVMDSILCEEFSAFRRSEVRHFPMGRRSPEGLRRLALSFGRKCTSEAVLFGQFCQLRDIAFDTAVKEQTDRRVSMSSTITFDSVRAASACVLKRIPQLPQLLKPEQLETVTSGF